MAVSNGQTPRLNPERLNLTLGLVALLALGLGLWQIRTLIYSPFVPPGASTTTVTPSASSGVEGTDVAALKARDTDGDGLSDYDELYLYHTSPYLKDTDSDGIDDKTEVQNGTDPTCAQGQTCTPTTLNGTGSATPGLGGTQPPTADQIRAFLKNNGATDQQLSKYDDATLLKLYTEVAGTTAVPAPTSSTTTQPATTKLSLTPEQKAKLLSLSGAELRALLKQSGVPEAQLNQFDDATLQALVKQVVNQ